MDLVDQAVETLLYRAVSAGGLAALSRALEKQVVVWTSRADCTCELRDPESVDNALDMIWSQRWYFGLQMDEFNLPRYLLFRTESEGWHDAEVSVEELFLSPRYSLPDERFATARDFGGRERQVVRLAPYRIGALKLVGRRNPKDADRLLATIGSKILLWTEDQRVVALIARHLGAPELLQAVEVLAFMKRAEHGLLRYRLEEQPAIARFFQDVYPNQALASLLGRLNTLSPTTLSELPDRAEALQRTLADALQRFLGTKIQRHGGIRRTVEELVMANIFRLEMLRPELESSMHFLTARDQLVTTCRSTRSAKG